MSNGIGGLFGLGGIGGSSNPNQYAPFGYNSDFATNAMTQAAIQNAYEGNQGFLGGLATEEQGLGQGAEGRQAPTVQAATMGAAQLGAAPTYQAAQSTPASVAQNGMQAENAAMSGLARTAFGGGPTVGDLAFKQAQAQSTAQQLGMAATIGGRDPAAAQRQASINAANSAQNNAAANAASNIQERYNAINALGGLGGQVQGQNLNAAQLAAANNQFNAGATNAARANNQNLLGQYGLQQGQFQQGANTANQNAFNAIAQGNQLATLQQQKQNDAFAAGMLGMAGDTSQAQYGNLQREQGFNAANYNATLDPNSKAYQAELTANQNMLGSEEALIGSAAGYAIPLIAAAAA